MAVLVVMFTTAALTVGVAVRQWLRDRPSRWSTPYTRLLDRNPTLGVDASLRWTVRARRARTGWLTSLAVSVAVLVASARLTTRPTAADR